MENKGTERYKCAKCGYVYDPGKGDPKHGIEPLMVPGTINLYSRGYVDCPPCLTVIKCAYRLT